MRNIRIILFASAALFVGAAVPAMALDLGIGGASVSGGSTSGGGTSVSAGVGGSSVGVTLGGGSNVATAGAGTGGTGVSVGVGSTSGDLVAVNQNSGTTDATVNLGSGLGGLTDTLNGVTGAVGTTLDGIDLGSLGGGGGGVVGGAGGGVLVAFAGLDSADQQRIKLRCRAVLSSPSGFSAQSVALCRLLARL